MENACSLQGHEVEEQRRRHEALARSATGAVFDGEAVTVSFGESLDRALLDDMIAVERRCCPFFDIAYDEGTRLLRIGVRDPSMAPALDVIAERLGAAA